MTIKTKRTLATIDMLAGVPHLHESRPHLVVPEQAWSFYEFREGPDLRKWWQTGRGKYDCGLLFRIK